MCHLRHLYQCPLLSAIRHHTGNAGRLHWCRHMQRENWSWNREVPLERQTAELWVWDSQACFYAGAGQSRVSPKDRNCLFFFDWFYKFTYLIRQCFKKKMTPFLLFFNTATLCWTWNRKMYLLSTWTWVCVTSQLVPVKSTSPCLSNTNSTSQHVIGPEALLWMVGFCYFWQVFIH